MPELLSDAAAQLDAHLKSAARRNEAEEEVILNVISELAASDGIVSNKRIILRLLERLETERDVTLLEVYRNALETIVSQTPDD